MERVRTGSPYSRQKSISSSSAGAPASPMMSPLHRHVRSGSAGVGNFRRTQNYAARAAAQRLARVMAHQPSAGDDSDEDEDLDPMPPIELSTPRRSQRSPSPAIGRYLAEQTPVRAIPASRPSMVAKPTAMIPPIKPSSKPVATSVAFEHPVVHRRDKRMSVDLGNFKETSSSRSSSVCQDEIDVLHEDESIHEKFPFAEERCEEVETSSRQLKKQITSLGKGGQLEARSFGRKEATWQQREAALKAASVTTHAKQEEAVILRSEAKIAKNEAVPAEGHVHGAESEIKSLRVLAQRMTLSQEQMEEVVLKRCWLARYWNLCVHHGIHADIAERKHEYWSSFAPLPLEVVLSAGEKARDGCSSDKPDVEEDKVPSDANDLAGEGNIENMLLVEKGLRELASLKVEDAVLFSMAQHRHMNIRAEQSSSGSRLSVEGSNPMEPCELSKEEKEDILFKQAWLTYFWRRAKNHGLEEDIADDRLQFWINQTTPTPTSQDAVEVERGLFELRKLGVESQLWEVSRRGFDDTDFSHRGSQPESDL